jgi:outer membrane protein OmpA-like peptidoglycan-associated protein
MTTRRIRYFSLSSLVFFIAFSAAGYAQSDSAKRIMARGYSDTHVENLKILNSSAIDATPFISPDEGTLYFSSYRDHGKEAIYKSKRKSLTEWGEPELFFALPGKEKISNLSIAADGRTCVLHAANREDGIFKTSDIYEAELDNGELKNIRNLGKGVNSEWWDSQPCISKDGQLLFFASDRKHGHGGSDIYMCTRNGSGGWSDPVDLSFNTSGNELSPFIASDNQTLYFASDNLPGGMGGLDIYVTYRKGENEWTEPKNLGPSVNSKYDDMFFFVPPAEDAVYFSSNRPGGEGNFDLYRIVPNPIAPKPKFISFRGQTLDAETGQAVRSEPEVTLEVVQSKEKLSNTGSARNYSAMAPIGKMLRVVGGANGYVNGSVEAQAPPEFDSLGFSQDLKLVPAKVVIKGHVINAFTGKALTADVVLHEEGGGQNSAQSEGSAGAYSFNAKVFSKYSISCDLKDYEPYESPIEIPLKREALITVIKEIRMTPAGIPPVMVNFDYDKSDLAPNEASKMSHFIEQVKQNPNVRLEISGHTDEHGSEEYNNALSTRRAKTVVDYLIDQGVARDQVAVVVGKGKSVPLVPETDEVARRKNRRVEVHIVGKQ